MVGGGGGGGGWAGTLIDGIPRFSSIFSDAVPRRNFTSRLSLSFRGEEVSGGRVSHKRNGTGGGGGGGGGVQREKFQRRLARTRKSYGSGDTKKHGMHLRVTV